MRAPGSGRTAVTVPLCRTRLGARPVEPVRNLCRGARTQRKAGRGRTGRAQTPTRGWNHLNQPPTGHPGADMRPITLTDAVEAAARAQYERASHPGAPRWEDCAETDRAVYRHAVRPHVEAAAPFIAARSLQDAAT